MSAPDAMADEGRPGESWVACLWVNGVSDLPGKAAGAGVVSCPPPAIGPAAADHQSDAGRAGRVLDIARECSPRVEVAGDHAVIVDATGLTRLFGGPYAFGEHVRRSGAARGVSIGIAIAATRAAAMVMASAHDGVSVVPRGREARTLASVPLPVLARLVPGPDGQAALASAVVPARHRRKAPSRHYRIAPGPDAPGRETRPHEAAIRREPEASRRRSLDLLATFERWGLRTLGDLAALPAAALAARLGDEGLRWRRWARGEDDRPLVRAPEEERFEASMTLDWPVEGLEPLSFVLARVLDPVCARLERRDRGAAVLHVWLKLVSRAVHHRALTLPVPMRDAKVLRTLLLLDLESHPPDAGIDAVTVAAEPSPGPVVQFSLLTRPLPSPDRVSALMARLTALMGEGRCGAPVLVDSHRPGAFSMVPFAPADDRPADARTPGSPPACVLRRLRSPVPARVTVAEGRPVRVTTRHDGLPGGRVTQAAGPWRTSGEWWQRRPTAVSHDAGPWDRDEWDLALGDRAAYRVHRNRATDGWFVEGVWD